MHRVWLATPLALVLAGCGAPQQGDAVSAPVTEGAASVSAETLAGVAAAPAPVEASTVPVVAPTAPRIAYVYHYGLEVPVDRAPALMARHEQACVAAGPAVCQVVGSRTTRVGQDDLNAQLEIRATPPFIARFRAGLADEAKTVGGRVAEATTESEDLTRSLIDTEARLRAQTTLRDRLQGLLASRSGSLEDLLKVETELARVQGQIDAEQSTLLEMRTRVATSRLTVEYRSAGQLAPDSAFRPVVGAIEGAFGAMMATLGVLITLMAVLLPVGLIAGPVAWWLIRRRRAAKRSQPPA